MCKNRNELRFGRSVGQIVPMANNRINQIPNVLISYTYLDCVLRFVTYTYISGSNMTFWLAELHTGTPEANTENYIVALMIF